MCYDLKQLLLEWSVPVPLGVIESMEDEVNNEFHLPASTGRQNPGGGRRLGGLGTVIHYHCSFLILYGNLSIYSLSLSLLQRFLVRYGL